MAKDILNIKTLDSICTKLETISKIAIVQYTLITNDIIDNRITNDNHIQRTLDGLLNLCFDEEILKIYRKLCKYYFNINPQATIDYVNYYKEMYDKSEIEFGSKLKL